MRLTIITTRPAGDLTIDNLDAASVLDMVEAMGQESVWHFSLDDGLVETYVHRSQVIRVDIEHEDPTGGGV